MSFDPIAFAKRGLAKAVHKATSAAGVTIEGLLDDLPNTEVLKRCRKISIKLEDQYEANLAIQRFISKNACHFNPLTFSVRDEEEAKKQKLTAELQPVKGFVVFGHRREDEMMIVTLPTKPSDHMLGKIEHPTGATFYKTTVTSNDRFVIWKTADDRSAFLVVTKRQNHLCRAATAAGFMFHDSLYLIARPGKETHPVAKLKPKLAPSHRTFVVKFMNGDVEVETRAVILGFALMMVLRESQPELGNLLRQTIIADQQP